MKDQGEFGAELSNVSNLVLGYRQLQSYQRSHDKKKVF